MAYVMETDEIRLDRLEPGQRELFIEMNQRSFQVAVDEEFGEGFGTAIPRQDIIDSIDSPTAETYAVMLDNTMIGGVCVNDNPKSMKTDLDLLFIDVPYTGKGFGTRAWELINAKYPYVKIWETHTPYFEKRNIHFYVNKLGFHIVEFYCPQNREPNLKSEDHDKEIPGGEYFFRFEKKMY